MRLTVVKPETKKIKRRIGSTEYEVNIYFSRTSRETMNDKVRRLITNEIDSKGAVRK